MVMHLAVWFMLDQMFNSWGNGVTQLCNTPVVSSKYWCVLFVSIASMGSLEPRCLCMVWSAGTSVSAYGMECLGFIVYGLRCERQKAEVFILPPSPSSSSYASACETTISSQKHAPFEQTPSPLFNPQVLTLVFFPV